MLINTTTEVVANKIAFYIVYTRIYVSNIPMLKIHNTCALFNRMPFLLKTKSGLHQNMLRRIQNGGLRQLNLPLDLND